MATPSKSKWLKIFCPEGACLREEERFSVPGCLELDSHAGGQRLTYVYSTDDETNPTLDYPD